jgi:serine/threonine protein kinase/tetratricopeptide (TPR) repeat protein
MNSPISLGPYRLIDQIGQGAMGDVWRAIHVVQQVPIAIKVMRNEPISSRARQAFINEISQVAKLDHQGIVMVFDYGDVSAADASGSDGALSEGHPYIAMEYSQRGSLDQLDEVLTWRDLLGITRSLLIALAHAHARQVLHRDIKPGNILLGSGKDLRPSIKLTDFGLARALGSHDRPGTGMRIVGTPDYMAPEQIEGLWRDQGPWTDLYAIGCVAYELAAGRPPFSGNSNRAVAAAHLSTPVPPLTSLSPVPEGFEAWLGRMLAKDGHARFRCAADAAHALDQLSDDRDLGRVARMGGQREASPTWTFLDLPPPRLARSRSTAGAALHPEDAPPVPEDWRELERRPPAAPLVGSSLSLFGLRTHRMIGRTAERDALWHRLQSVSTLGRSGAVLLRGPAGHGKHRLAHWLMQTAYEAGAASVLEATHSEIPGPAHGLPRMLAKRMQTIGLSASEVIGRTEAMLRLQGVDDPFEWEHLGRMLLSTSGAISSDMRVPVGSASERLALVARFIERETIHRPVVIHISDAQWGLEALGLARRMLQARGDRLPLLFLISCDTEALEQRPVERRFLRVLSELPDLETMEIGPMPAEDQAALIRDLLRVEPGLARSVQKRSGGSPLFAIQVVEDWVRRGVLQPGPEGFCLPKGEATALPDSIHEIWQGRIEQALLGLDPSVRRGLTIAAALGLEVEEEDWVGACATLQAERSTQLITRLVSNGLAVTRPAGWAFTHGMLRESIQRSAGSSWAEINRGCANMLAGRAPGPGMKERIGRHLVAAGEAEDSLEPLLEGAWENIRLGDYHRAGNLLSLREQMQHEIPLPPEDVRWGAGWIAQCLVHENHRELEQAKALASRCAERARRNNWSEILGPAFRWRGIIAHHLGDLSEADAMFARAESLVEPNSTERANVLRHWARAMRVMGDTAGAIRHLERALELFREAGEELEEAHCIYQTAAVLQSISGKDREAEANLARAMEIYLKLDYTAGVGDCWNGIAEVHRQRSDLSSAEEAYETAHKYLARYGAVRAIVPIINRGLICLQRDDHERAQETFEDCLTTLTQSGQEVLQTYCHLGLLSCAAYSRDWHAFDHHLSCADRVLTKTGAADRDLAWPAERGGDRAVAEGERKRAERAWLIALAQWEQIGATDQAERLSRRLGKTGG